jgi:hypothetical protein
MLSLLADTKLRLAVNANVVNPKTELLTVKELVERRAYNYVYDWFGEVHQISGFSDHFSNEESLWRIDALSGEPLIVGEKHGLLCRQKGSARYERRTPVELQYYGKPVYVRMPQRKVVCDDILFENFAADEKSVHIVAPTARDLLPIMEAGATAGLGVHRSKGELRVDLEKNRPVCFATKLINGNFQENLGGTLEELTAGAIICPSHRFDDQYVDLVEKTGIVFEGWTFFNDVLVVPPRPIEKTGRVYHIEVAEHVPIELTWFCT